MFTTLPTRRDVPAAAAAVGAAGPLPGRLAAAGDDAASTGGWACAQFDGCKRASEAVHGTCFPCHATEGSRPCVQSFRTLSTEYGAKEEQLWT
jgi:hypothetical protein